MATELPFPKSLPEFQKLFPDDAHCGAYLERQRLRLSVVRDDRRARAHRDAPKRAVVKCMNRISMGPSIPANLVSACRKCNKTRGNLSYEEWLRHPFYMNVSSNLSPTEQLENQRLLQTLAAIPRMVHVRSR